MVIFPPRLAVSGPDGQFLFEHVAPGTIDIRPAAQHGFSFVPASQAIIMGTSNQDIHFTATPNAGAGFCLHGVVTDKAGRGIGGINVMGQSEANSGVFYMAQTGANGSFTLGSLPVGFWRVEPQAKDFEFMPESRRVSITTECVANLNFREKYINEPPPPQPEEGGPGVSFPVLSKDGTVVIISIKKGYQE